MQAQQQHLTRKKLRYLVIGRMGEGKSALCKYLTGVDSILANSKVQSCTKKCSIYSSIDKLNQERGVQIQVIDTPGLDSQQDSLFQIMSDLLSILNQIEKINGILYVVSMTSVRDQTISWFLNFLSFLFSEQQLQQSIIPILTNYDKVLFENQSKIQQAKRSRQQVISKIWRSKSKEPINFWKNHINWINDAGQDEDLYLMRKFRQVYQKQMKILIQMTKNNQLKTKESMDKFDQQFETEVFQLISKSNERLITVEQHINKLKINAAIQEKNFKILFTPISGWIVFLGLLISNADISERAQNSVQKLSGSKIQILSKVLDKIFYKQFVRQLQTRFQIKRVTPFRQKIFSAQQQRGYIQLKLLTEECYIKQKVRLFFSEKQVMRKTKRSLMQIKDLQIKRVMPGTPQFCTKVNTAQQAQQKNKTANKQLKFMLFKDKGSYKQVNREYELNNLVIKRPSDQYFSGLLKRMILKH